MTIPNFSKCTGPASSLIKIFENKYCLICERCFKSSFERFENSIINIRNL